MSKLFSIVVLVYNNRQYLTDSLASVFSQDYDNIEVVVVDDGSTEYDQGYVEDLFQKYAGTNIRAHLVYQNEKNYGTVKSANGAIRLTHGEYVKLLAADDALFDSHTLSNAAEALKKCSDGMVTGKVMKCDLQMNPIGLYKNGLQHRLNDLSAENCFKHLCVHNDIIAGGVFFTRSFYDRMNGFDEEYRLLEDWPTWLKATASGCRICYEPFFAVRYRCNNGVGTGSNPMYMADKQRVLNSIIIPSRRRLGLYWYLRARFCFWIINSVWIRKIYGMIFRRS